MDSRHIKAEPGMRDRSNDDTRTSESKTTYKSYKKKYRKLRLQFDQNVQESEDLHRTEQKAIRTMKRLAIENDRLMDVLLDINESPQIPPERKINLDNDGGEDTEDEQDASQKPTKSLKSLVEEVPHQSFAEVVKHDPVIFEFLNPQDPDVHPSGFLTANDVDTYLTEIDAHLDLKLKPTVPPPATDPRKSATNFALRNPTSVYNWLRRHAPKTFLQDMDKEKDKDREKNDDEGGSSKRKSGAARGAKRQSAAHRKEAGEPTEWDEEAAAGGDGRPSFGSARGKRKRDDDGGYRPKGGASRPTKRRARKSGV